MRLISGLVACLAFLSACATPARQAQPRGSERPNIVLIFTDDLGYGDLSSYGHPTLRTPRLDRMAREGIRMTSFYSADPVCTPSRAALLTGRYPIRSGMTRVLFPNADTGLPHSEITLAEALKERGYRTAAIGKWHLGHLPRFLPTAHGFDSYFGVPYSNDMDRTSVGEPPTPLIRDTVVVEAPADQSTLTERYTEEAIRIIRESRGEPFFVYLAHTMPHAPIYASERFRGRSRAGLYGDVVETIDWSAGRILDTLRELGLDRNTIVIFTSDNGPWIPIPQRHLVEYGSQPWDAGSAGPLRGVKATTWEGGVRVPAIVRWPGVIAEGQESAEIATTMDLFSTLIGIAGGRVPSDRPVDGLDILPLLATGAESPRTGLYYFRAGELEGVREGRWKLRVSDHAPGPTGVPGAAAAPTTPLGPQLFDLEVDPGERFDVAAKHPEVVQRLRSRMREFAGQVAVR